MVLFFPQWQGANRRDSIIRGAKTLKQYYGKEITHRVITESHTMITSKTIRNYSAIYNQALRCRELLKASKPEKIFTIGGDCGIELMPISYLNERYENLGIIWFDAHADANTPASSSSKNFHGMPLRQLCGDGDQELGELCFSTIDPNQILYLGLRDVDGPEHEWIKKKTIFKSPKAEISNILSILQERKVEQIYIHFDIDVLHPNDYQHLLLPVDNGLSISHTVDVLEMLKNKFEVVGTSLTEVIAGDRKDLEPIEEILEVLASSILQ